MEPDSRCHSCFEHGLPWPEALVSLPGRRNQSEPVGAVRFVSPDGSEQKDGLFEGDQKRSSPTVWGLREERVHPTGSSSLHSE